MTPDQWKAEMAALVERALAAARREGVEMALAACVRRARSVEALCPTSGDGCRCPACGRVADAIAAMAGAL